MPTAVIRTVDKFLKRIGEAGHGTDIGGSRQRTYQGARPRVHHLGLMDATFRMVLHPKTLTFS